MFGVSSTPQAGHRHEIVSARPVEHDQRVFAGEDDLRPFWGHDS